MRRRPSGALDGLVRDGDGVLLLGLEHLGEDAWAVLTDSGLRLLRVAETAAAVDAVAEGAAQIVVTDALHGPPLISAVRARPSWPACTSSSAPTSTRRTSCATRSTPARTT